MATVRPFQAVRPRADIAYRVAALPYDVLNSEEAREKTKENPYSFLHVDKAEVDLEKNISLYDKRVYEKARESLRHMMEMGILKKDSYPCYYIYRLTMDGRRQTGLVACTSIDEYLDGTIKKHELTRADKEQDRISHVEYCNANTGPIFMAYRGNDIIDVMLDGWAKNHVPVYDFTADDGIGHTVWVINNDITINRLTELFRQVPNLYIADGHHRNASAVKVGLKKREEHPAYTGEEEFNYYLSVLFPEKELKILDYNRLVKDLNGLEENEFLKKLEEKFEVERLSEKEPFHPRQKMEFGLYMNKTWYRLRRKEDFEAKNTVERLDVSILQEEVLIPILGIQDVRTDKRIDFVGGIRGLKELERRVDSGEMKLAFSMFPTTIEELMQVADEGEIMPPKSTWFEPKLRSGLFIHEL